MHVNKSMAYTGYTSNMKTCQRVSGFPENKAHAALNPAAHTVVLGLWV